MTIPIYDESAAVACTASKPELGERAGQLESLRTVMRRIDRTGDGLLIEFAPSPETESALQRFAVDEKGCCAFWGFDVRTGDNALVLQWDGPPTVAEFLDRIHVWFLTDAPLTLDAGLL